MALLFPEDLYREDLFGWRLCLVICACFVVIFIVLWVPFLIGLFAGMFIMAAHNKPRPRKVSRKQILSEPWPKMPPQDKL